MPVFIAHTKCVYEMCTTALLNFGTLCGNKTNVHVFQSSCCTCLQTEVVLSDELAFLNLWFGNLVAHFVKDWTFAACLFASGTGIG